MNYPTFASTISENFLHPLVVSSICQANILQFTWLGDMNLIAKKLIFQQCPALS